MRIIFFLSFLLLFYFSNAQVVGNQLSVASAYTVDSSSRWSIADLKHKRFYSFKQNDKVNIGYNKYAAVWCVFKIKNRDVSKGAKVWLCFNNNHIDSLTLYANHQMLETIGDRTTNQSPFIESLAFELNFKPNEERVFFAKIKKQTSFLDFSYNLEDRAPLEAKSSKKIVLVAFLCGIVFLLLMVNGILFFMTKNRLYIFYITYSILTVFYTVITTNFAKHVLFPEFLFFSECRLYIGALWYLALSSFLTFFLNLKAHQPLKYRFIKVLNLVNLLFILVTILLLVFYPGFDFRYFYILGYVILLIVTTVLLWASILHIRIEKLQAFYVLIAFAPQFVWVVCVVLRTFKVIPNSLGDNWMVIISLYEVFLFGYVLSRNYIEIFLKNNELMQEVILEKESSLKTISEVQLRERRNIANIIHDNVGSKIAHIVHLFDMKKDVQAKHTIDELAEDIRDLSHKILPKALDDGALVSSVGSQIQSLNAGLKNSTIEFFHYDFPEKIEVDWIYDLYLSTLEILNNAVKHGKAKLITVEFYKYPDSYHFQFTDDGVGFDLLETRKGFGLENIEKRIKYYHGDFEINSVKTEGTIIQMSIPVH